VPILTNLLLHSFIESPDTAEHCS